MLTPVDIQNKDFGRGWRGYREGEVRAFLEQIVEGYQELYRENQELREQITRLEQVLKKYQEWEQTLKDTLLLAQRAAEETRRNAEKEGELIQQEARRRAEELVSAARAEVEKLQRHYESLQQQALAAAGRPCCGRSWRPWCCWKERKRVLRLPVRVQPRAKRNEVYGWEGGVLKVRVTAPPVAGAANEACLRVLAAWLGVPRSRLAILHGEGNRHKLIGVAGMDEGYLHRLLEERQFDFPKGKAYNGQEA
jgi:cell division initiation protein